MTRDEQLKLQISESELEEFWDWICVRIGFDKKGKEIQQAMKKFVELKLKEHEKKLTNKQ